MRRDAFRPDRSFHSTLLRSIRGEDWVYNWHVDGWFCVNLDEDIHDVDRKLLPDQDPPGQTLGFNTGAEYVIRTYGVRATGTAPRDDPERLAQWLMS